MAAAHGGLHVGGQREYYSNIKGKHSYYKLRLDADEVRAPIEPVHLLATYENETVCRHLEDRMLVDGGAIIYDPAIVDETVADQRFMDKRVKDDLAERLGKPAVKLTVEEVLEAAEPDGVTLYPFPYEELMKVIAEELGMDDHHKLQILKNTMSVAASLAVMGYDMSILDETLEEIFEGKKAAIIEMNQVAARHSAEYMQENFPDFPFQLEPVDTDEERIYLQGTDAVALGKMLAGCRMQTYYPISPATDESVYIESKPESGITVVQTEDEISAVDMAIGAALTGARSSTSTSGPGVNLMVEGLGFAGICEVPLVLINYQRGGPSTGLPTRSEQGDLQFILNLGNGEFPRLVLLPGDVHEMFRDTIDAFNLAERYQTPVIVNADKDQAGNSSTTTPFDLEGVEIDRGKLLTEADIADSDLSEDGKFLRFADQEDGISYRTIQGQEGGVHWLTSDEHVETGHITEDVRKREMIMEKRMRKLETALDDLAEDRLARLHGPENAEITVVSWGSTKGAILEALGRLNQDGDVANFLQIRIASPFPAERVNEVLSQAGRTVCIENNFSGQMANVIRQHTGIDVDHRSVKYNGRPMTVEDILSAVENVRKKGDARHVIRTGV